MKATSKNAVIMLAGGIGKRMNSKMPKQFLPLHGEPILVSSIKKFLDFDNAIYLIVVLVSTHIDEWEPLLASYFKEHTHQIFLVSGGTTRSESVRAGLKSLPKHIALVAIHDAVRPFVNRETILRSFEAAQIDGSGVAAVPLKDAIRKRENGSLFVACNKKDFMIVQTPQTYRVKEIQHAYQKFDKESFDDDATVYEKGGYKVTLVEGCYENIKITTPSDLQKEVAS